MTTDLILGTAGHIDHGKTSLIRALTGVDTDRLPEEKKRGITIDLGFAELVLGQYRLGIVDVPGHERFVRNMLAGATGMDLALLVVAADDSIKPQTREHLEILRLLDLHAGVIAITKCDLADPDWIALVEEEVRELVAETFLAHAPVVRTSASSLEGLEQLRQELLAAAQRAAATRAQSVPHAPFRMAIDRTFTIAGHGTVVTGSVSSGSCRLGDELVIEPGHLRCVCVACRIMIAARRSCIAASGPRSTWPASTTNRSSAVRSCPAPDICSPVAGWPRGSVPCSRWRGRSRTAAVCASTWGPPSCWPRSCCSTRISSTPLRRPTANCFSAARRLRPGTSRL